ncbi:MAG: methionine adenosyltransferase domain-containing protein [Clostridia bacterium]|nr:methionine adenosyltransferase domain-containing protein [Clostridia bacterium]
MILLAEYVSSGQPDRLCDVIVDNIVNYVVSKDKDALCELECSVYNNKVYVNGRIAAGKDEKIINEEKIKEIVRNVYNEVGYGKKPLKLPFYFRYLLCHPFPEELDIISNVRIEKLSDDERALRQYSDDLNIVNGYALNYPLTDYLPIEHFIALKIGERLKDPKIGGPDYKILIQIEKENGNLCWRRLTISIQQIDTFTYKDLYQQVKRKIDYILRNLFSGTLLNSLSTIDRDHFYLNGAGDFIQGGPEGDNGLSGKKLCVDFYGPSIPIGGGAIYGKDPHKVDVCGAFRARELAVNLVKKYGYYSVFTTLAWSPGEQSPYIIEAYEIDEFGTKFKIDDSLLPPRDFFSIECINNDMNLGERKITSIKDIK